MGHTDLVADRRLLRNTLDAAVADETSASVELMAHP